MREDAADPLSALAVLLVVELRAEHFGRAFDEGEAFAFEIFLGAVDAAEFVELGFVFEKVNLRWRAGHVEVDNGLGFGGDFEGGRCGCGR